MEGIQAGKLEGELKGKLEVAENLLKMGLTVEQVVKGTGLPKREVTKIKTRLKL